MTEYDRFDQNSDGRVVDGIVKEIIDAIRGRIDNLEVDYQEDTIHIAKEDIMNLFQAPQRDHPERGASRQTSPDRQRTSREDSNLRYMLRRRSYPLIGRHRRGSLGPTD
jgi:hypothetical protein